MNKCLENHADQLFDKWWEMKKYDPDFDGIPSVKARTIFMAGFENCKTLAEEGMENRSPRFQVGTKVHVDMDDPEWGRVSSDGVVIALSGVEKYLVNIESVRADLIVDERDMQYYHTYYQNRELP